MECLSLLILLVPLVNSLFVDDFGYFTSHHGIGPLIHEMPYQPPQELPHQLPQPQPPYLAPYLPPQLPHHMPPQLPHELPHHLPHEMPHQFPHLTPHHAGDIVRPCHVDDWDCQRAFLAANSNCKMVAGRVPDPFYIPRVVLTMPWANVTILIRNMYMGGVSHAKVSEFYLNKATGNVVIGITVAPLIHRKAYEVTSSFQIKTRDSIRITEWVNATNPMVTVTGIIPKVPHLSLRSAKANGYLDDPNVRIQLGPRISASPIRRIKHTDERLSMLKTQVGQESIRMQAPYILNAFIQSVLCDFGDDTYNYFV